MNGLPSNRFFRLDLPVAAFVSRELWLIAARARVTYDPKPNDDEFYPSGIQMMAMTASQP